MPPPSGPGAPFRDAPTIVAERSSQPPPADATSGSSKRNAAATRARILDAGEREFAARGFAGARLREIAVSAGVQPALIHHYFVDKQGLYRAVLDRALLPTSTESWTLLETHTDLDSLLAGFADVMLRFYAANLRLLSILRHDAISGSSVLVEVTRERTLPIVQALTELLRQRQATGEVRADVPAHEILVAGMSMVAYPFVEEGMLNIMLPEAVVRDDAGLARRRDAVLKLLLAALRPPGPETKESRAAAPVQPPRASGRHPRVSPAGRVASRRSS